MVDVINMNFYKNILIFDLKSEPFKWNSKEGLSGVIEVKQNLTDDFQVFKFSICFNILIMFENVYSWK